MMFRIVLIGYIVIIIFGRALTPYDPRTTQPEIALQAPTWAHPAGTDALGRDVLSRALHGGTQTLTSAAAAACLALGIGLLVGLRMGGTRIDAGIDTLIAAGLTIPSIIVALLAITLIGNSDWALIIAVSTAQIAPVARLTRTLAQGAARADYVQAADALGARPLRLLTRHILPNIVPTLAAYACVTFGACIMNGATLTFLGLGGEIGRAEWGAMLYEGRQAFRTAPWIAFVPGIGITCAVLLLNELSDRLTRIR
ncbi:MAG: ABC transporter permease [Chloroflexota bacterium]|nr:ABC transporter permease [Chloroflexota bacterium]